MVVPAPGRACPCGTSRPAVLGCHTRRPGTRSRHILVCSPPGSWGCMDERARRKELGHFLRTRRERLPPERFGLTRGTRRRTPGLRREEVAQLAGLGVTWYTWLEQ